ncbi:glutamate-5-semialdehyde dehydrogenase [Oleiharenicola sp. Vm1]|uniref:glutamate-5-semialdehyde dehydrogenase n=1 Tax=Oleiharenicola sp. Vm1 TaxID=3398393 RepID=UPI0039F62D4A
MAELAQTIREMGRRARAAAAPLALASRADKDRALRAMADALLAARDEILAANAADLAAGERAGLSRALLDRLRLDEPRLAAMADGVRAVADLPDPVGRVQREWTHANGARFSRISVPIGVIGIIYESRPNVTSDAASLCLKAGNAVILRGGSESLRTNLAVAAALARGLAASGLPADAVQLVPVADREAVKHLVALDEFVNLIIPRGGRGLIEAVVASARVPVIKHYDGICALYVDAAADLAMAESIALNAKCQRPGVCNAIETLLVHRAVADKFLTAAGRALLERGVQLRVDAAARAALGPTLNSQHSTLISTATAADFRTEFLDLILAVKVVDDLDAAIAHIEAHGSHHSDAIVTADAAAAEQFLNRVDSATVYWNASTRFTDGGEFGFGAEIGISTDRLHARGPMGLEELTTYKYVIRGDGQVR